MIRESNCNILISLQPKHNICSSVSVKDFFSSSVFFSHFKASDCGSFTTFLTKNNGSYHHDYAKIKDFNGFKKILTKIVSMIRKS